MNEPLFDTISLREDSAAVQNSARSDSNQSVACQQTIEPQLPEQFVLLEKLGEGGMGSVYKARNKVTNKIVAIKLMRHSRPSDVELCRFQREAEATTKFSHPNAVEVLDFGVFNQTPYLVMEYLDGKVLDFRLKAVEALSESETVSIFIDVCAALSKAHAAGVVHRDLKPSNIMLQETKTGRIAKILDFGIAKLVNGESTVQTTQTGEVFGTPLYMSPEQFTGQSVSFRSDVYSIGAVMYQCLAGEAPHVSDSAYGIMYKRLQDKPKSFADMSKQVSYELERIVFRCLSLEESGRYSNAGEILRDLERRRDAIEVGRSFSKIHNASASMHTSCAKCSYSRASMQACTCSRTNACSPESAPLLVSTTTSDSNQQQLKFKLICAVITLAFALLSLTYRWVLGAKWGQ